MNLRSFAAPCLGLGSILLLLGCGAAASGDARTNGGPPAKSRGSASPIPPFTGAETDAWFAFETGPVERDDLLLAFEESAKRRGCRTDRLGLRSTQNIYGESRRFYGVSASCDDGTLALIPLENRMVRVGCAKPTTVAECESLLRRISSGE